MLTWLEGPLKQCEKIRYPPVYQVMGTEDDIFEITHVNEFHEALAKTGVKCEKVLVQGAGHALDMWAEIGGDLHKGIISPAVEWVAACAGVKKEQA